MIYHHITWCDIKWYCKALSDLRDRFSQRVTEMEIILEKNESLDAWMISHSFLSLSEYKNECFEFVRGSMQKWDVILILNLTLILFSLSFSVAFSFLFSPVRSAVASELLALMILTRFFNITVRLYQSINLFLYLLTYLLLYSFTYLLILFINLFIYKHFISYYPFDYEFNRYHYIMLLHQNICTKYDLHI